MALKLNANQTWEQLAKETKDEMLESFWEHGLHLIPCGSKQDFIPEYFRSKHPFETEEEVKMRWSKTPRVKWSDYQRRQPTEEELTNWLKIYPGANWAALTGINFVVLDADSQEAVDFIEEGNTTRTTLKQSTPRGGFHYFYSINTNLEVRNSAGHNKLDVRGTGGYVMVCPSEHYFFHTPDTLPIESLDELPSLTQQDLDAIHTFNNKGKVESIVKQPLTTRGVDSGTRNATLSRLVGRWIREGWGQRELLIKAHDWNQSNQPPMAMVEVATTVQSIINGHMKRHPEDLDGGVIRWNTSTWEVQLGDELKEILEQEDPILDTSVPEPEGGPLALKSYADNEWQEMDSDGIEQYWGDAFIFERARVLLIGKPKIGKSHWLGAFAVAAATGTEFMGTAFSRPMKVVWLQAEIIQEFLKNRIDLYFQQFLGDPELLALGQSNLIPSGRLRKNFMRDQDIDMISEEIAFHKPDIVMLDPFINFFDGEENNNADIHKVLDRVDKLIDLHNIAFIIAHHTGKERADDMSFMSARGGSVFAGWFDSGIKLLGDKPNVTMFYEARNAREPESHAAAFDYGKGKWTRVEFEQGPDEIEIASVVAKQMDITKFYTRADMEFVARQALKKAKMASGERAARYAVSYVQKYLGDRVRTHVVPGKQTWHYLAKNEGKKPWEDED